MKPKQLLFVLMLLTLTLGLAACIPEDSAPQRAWIDYPIEGETLPVGEAIQVILHGYARDGLADALLSVNGEAYRRDAFPVPGEEFDELHQEWRPEAEGVYTLQVIVYDQTGAASLPAFVSVQVTGSALPAPTGGECTPDALIAPLLVAPADGATLEPDPLLQWAYPDESCHPHSYAIDIAEDPSFADISWGFGTLDHTETSRTWPLPAGQCYYWRVRAYAPDAFGPASPAWSFCVNGPTETPTNTPEIPDTPTFTPTLAPATNTPTLHPPTWTPTPTATRTPIPADTTPPPAPAPVVPANNLELSCRATQTLAWTPVNDPSGIEGYYVELEKEISPGNWQNDSEWGPISGKQIDVSVNCGLRYRWIVRARDGAGNFSNWSAISNFAILLD